MKYIKILTGGGYTITFTQDSRTSEGQATIIYNSPQSISTCEKVLNSEGDKITGCSFIKTITIQNLSDRSNCLGKIVLSDGSLNEQFIIGSGKSKTWTLNKILKANIAISLENYYS